MIKNIFKKDVLEEVIERINSLNPDSQPQWGKMSVSQMLAHNNVAYEMTYEDKHKRPNAIMRFFIKLFAKETVIGEKPYKKNGRTAPEFIISDERDFLVEKERLIAYVTKTYELGEKHFEGKENMSFGKISARQWNNLFYKHLDHHLRQFGV